MGGSGFAAWGTGKAPQSRGTRWGHVLKCKNVNQTFSHLESGTLSNLPLKLLLQIPSKATWLDVMRNGDLLLWPK